MSPIYPEQYVLTERETERALLLMSTYSRQQPPKTPPVTRETAPTILARENWCSAAMHRPEHALKRAQGCRPVAGAELLLPDVKEVTMRLTGAAWLVAMTARAQVALGKVEYNVSISFKQRRKSPIQTRDSPLF